MEETIEYITVPKDVYDQIKGLAKSKKIHVTFTAQIVNRPSMSRRYGGDYYITEHAQAWVDEGDVVLSDIESFKGTLKEMMDVAISDLDTFHEEKSELDKIKNKWWYKIFG